MRERRLKGSMARCAFVEVRLAPGTQIGWDLLRLSAGLLGAAEPCQHQSRSTFKASYSRHPIAHLFVQNSVDDGQNYLVR